MSDGDIIIMLFIVLSFVGILAVIANWLTYIPRKK